MGQTLPSTRGGFYVKRNEFANGEMHSPLDADPRCLRDLRSTGQMSLGRCGCSGQFCGEFLGRRVVVAHHHLQRGVAHDLGELVRFQHLGES